MPFYFNYNNPMQFRKAITYQAFMELPVQTRKQHSKFFKDNYGEYCPVILKVLHGNKQIALKMCKFLIRKNRSIAVEQQVIKSFVLKHSQGAISKTDQIAFLYRRKVLNPHITVQIFLEEKYEDDQGDGWLHLIALTQDVYG